jgi:hypothetical protein
MTPAAGGLQRRGAGVGGEVLLGQKPVNIAE